MRADIISLSQLEPRDLSAWEQLAELAISPNPFLEPGFVLPAARGLRATEVAILVVREGGDWLAALPVRRVSSWRGVPGRALASWRHLYCFLATPLVAGADSEAVLAELIAGGLRASGCLILDYVDAEEPLSEPLARALAAGSRCVELDLFERATIYHRESGDYLERTVSAAHRGNLRRVRRRLEDSVGELTLRERSDDPVAYEEFLSLEGAGWKGEGGTALACDLGHIAFFRDMCAHFARAGRLEVLALASEERNVAMKVNLRAGRGTFGFKTTFDETLSKFSPGIQLELASVAHFHASPSAWIDSCGDPRSKTLNRIWGDRRRFQALVACRRGASGAGPYVTWTATAAALPELRRIRERARGRSGSEPAA
jgi:CelD/BcsL family acetyltransferase involved in cellulose biosynthesis